MSLILTSYHIFLHLGYTDPVFYQWEIQSGTGDLEHFVSLCTLFALSTNVVDHNFNVADVVNLGATNPEVSQNLLY